MLKQTIALVSLTLSLSVNSAIVDLGNITRDTDSGLDWLDLTETMGLSYNEVTSKMGAGAIYEGWRYASAHELDQLIVNFGYVAINQNCDYGVLHCDTQMQSDSATIEQMILTLGDSYGVNLDDTSNENEISPLGAGALYGYLGSQLASDEGAYDIAIISDQEFVDRATGSIFTDNNDRVETITSAFFPYNSTGSLGSFLVQSSELTAVPVPAAAWLFGSALVGLAGIKRKK